MGDRNSNLPKVKIRDINCKQGAVRAVRFSVDGNYCLTAGQDKTLKLWNPNRGSLLKTYSGHGYEVLDAMGSCDNNQIVSCGLDKMVILWDVSSGNVARKWRGHAAAVNCVKLNEESSVAISGSVDTTVKIWDCRSKSQEPVQTLEECGDNVTSLDVSDHEILVGSGDSQVRRYDLRNGQLATDFMGATDNACSWDAWPALSSSWIRRPGKCCRNIAAISTVIITGWTSLWTKQTNTCCRAVKMDRFIFGTWWRVDHGGGQTVHSLATHPSKCQLLTAARGNEHVWQDQVEEEEIEEETVLSSSSCYDSKPHWM